MTTPYSQWVKWRRCDRKRAWPTWEQAADAMHSMAQRLGEDASDFCIYQCSCGLLHFGHRRAS
jgi:hypothetical protein